MACHGMEVFLNMKSSCTCTSSVACWATYSFLAQMTSTQMSYEIGDATYVDYLPLSIYTILFWTFLPVSVTRLLPILSSHSASPHSFNFQVHRSLGDPPLPLGRLYNIALCAPSAMRHCLHIRLLGAHWPLLSIPVPTPDSALCDRSAPGGLHGPSALYPRKKLARKASRMYFPARYSHSSLHASIGTYVPCKSGVLSLPISIPVPIYTYSSTQSPFADISSPIPNISTFSFQLALHCPGTILL